MDDLLASSGADSSPSLEGVCCMQMVSICRLLPQGLGVTVWQLCFLPGIVEAGNPGHCP